MKKSLVLSLLLMLIGWMPAVAQIQDPVQFKSEWKSLSDTEAQIVFTADIDAGWLGGWRTDFGYLQYRQDGRIGA